MYGARIARGCQTCKKRKIKCDERRPTCRQCAKACRECPGYRDDFDIVLRDETQATESRVRKAKAKALAQRAIEDMQLSVRGGQATRYIETPPTFPIMEKAACHFLSNYILLPPQGTIRGYLDLLIPLLKNSPPPHFRLAFEACALASLGNRASLAQQIEKQALVKYTSALASMAVAINDPRCAEQNATLAAVLLLSLFENIKGVNPGVLAWGSHTEGAVQLVQRRGPKLLETKMGVDLFVAVRTQVIIHACASGKAPTLGSQFWISHGAPKDKVGTVCQHITLQLGEFRVELNKMLLTLPKTPENLRLMHQMILRCKDLDNQLVRWTENLPQYFQCRTVAWEEWIPGLDYSKAEVLPGRIDAFENLWAASIWSTLWCSRIVLASLHLRATAWVCAPIDYRQTPEYVTASRTTIDIITCICATVPYQLGWFANRRELLARADLTSFACGQDNTAKSLAGYFVTLPLSCVLTQDYSSDLQREWARGRLFYIYRELGVHSAKALTELNIRVPSMMIGRDAMVAKGMKGASELDRIVTSQTVPPSGLAAIPISRSPSA